MRRSEAIWNEKQQRWIIKVQSDGMRKTFADLTPGKRGKVLAERKADDWLEHRTVGTTTRCEVLLDKFVEQKKLTTGTDNYLQVESIVRRRIKPAIGSKKISHVTEADLQEIINAAFADGLAKKSIKNIRGVITAFFKYCRKAKATTLFPEDLTIPKGAPSVEKHIATPKDIKLLFSKDRTKYRNKVVLDRFIHAYRFQILTGLRPGELFGLKWDDVDGDKLTIRRAINKQGETTRGKNDNAHRTISIKGLPRKEIDAQRTMLAREGIISEYVFPDRDADFIRQKNYLRSWNEYCKHNGISKLTPYELRHTYVSVNDEMPDGLKKKAVGHSANMDTEGTYGHLKAGDLDRIADYSTAAFTKIISSKNK